MFCVDCGHKQEDASAKFCGRCGKALFHPTSEGGADIAGPPPRAAEAARPEFISLESLLKRWPRLPLVVVGVVVGLLLLSWAPPHVSTWMRERAAKANAEHDYQAGIAAFEAGRWSEAFTLLQRSQWFKGGEPGFRERLAEADERLQEERKIAAANDLLRDGKWEEGYLALEALANLKTRHPVIDAMLAAARPKYAEALSQEATLLGQGSNPDWDGAVSALERLVRVEPFDHTRKRLEDAKAQRRDYAYEAAIRLMHDGKLDEARRLLSSVGDYRYSKAIGDEIEERAAISRAGSCPSTDCEAWLRAKGLARLHVAPETFVGYRNLHDFYEAHDIDNFKDGRTGAQISAKRQEINEDYQTNYRGKWVLGEVVVRDVYSDYMHAEIVKGGHYADVYFRRPVPEAMLRIVKGESVRIVAQFDHHGTGVFTSHSLRDAVLLSDPRTWGEWADKDPLLKPVSARGIIGVVLVRANGACVVDKVSPKLPAEAAGVQAGDIVRAVDGVEVRFPTEFQWAMWKHARGETATIDFDRDGNRSSVKIVLASYAEAPDADAEPRSEAPPKSRLEALTSAFDYVNRGAARGQKGDLDGEIEDDTKAIEMDPKFSTAWNNRGWVKAKKGDFDGAVADCSRAIGLAPNDAWPWKNRALAYLGAGDLDRAIADSTKAIEREPKLAEAYLIRGTAWQRKHEAAKAADDLRQFLALAPNDPQAASGRALLDALGKE